MANDSSTGGYLQPVVASPPIEDAALDAIFQQMIVGLTGIPGAMVRPRWQPVTPKMPEPNQNWCAIGVTEIEQDARPAFVHVPDTDGTDKLYRHEILTLLASFYGPSAMQYAAQARDGIYVEQNHGMLTLNSMGLVDVGKMTAAPELINQQWLRRFDLSFRVRRQVVRTYSVLNVLSSDSTLNTDTVTTEIHVSQ
ncbi:phage neck terminator protein [Caballeronia telluris]|uniref:Bacteriophage protein n=1 Tax=Caballeronia telluris TaxID=326475 RepID=A0A158G0V1_9BURK|nr:hypothetical protein [Caballeronia telluris]SAL25758.1 putative bacteriophage protein [Caballeronia telluris]